MAGASRCDRVERPYTHPSDPLAEAEHLEGDRILHVEEDSIHGILETRDDFAALHLGIGQDHLIVHSRSVKTRLGEAEPSGDDVEASFMRSGTL